MAARRELLDVVVQAYRVEQTPADWLRAMHALVTARLDRGHGVLGYFVDCSRGFSAWDLVMSETTGSTLRDGFPSYDREVSIADKRAIHTFTPCSSNDALPVRLDANRWLGEWTRAWSVLGINAVDGSFRGCSFSRWEPRPRARPFAPTEVEDWSYLATHLAAGARLVHSVAGVDFEARAEAILSPDGTVVHASGTARVAAAREALRTATLAADRARTRAGRAHPRESLRAWQALVAGRWSVVDHFDSDGRRFVLAQPNDPLPQRNRTLSVRERQVANAAALGHSNKLIAYELGVTTSTVARLLARARAKLGARSRVDLIRRLREPSD